MMKSFVVISAMLMATSALAYGPYPKPTNDGRQRIFRTGSCPTGYVGKRQGKSDFCEAIHKDTPSAMPRIKGAACPNGYFASGDACKAFR